MASCGDGDAERTRGSSHFVTADLKPCTVQGVWRGHWVCIGDGEREPERCIMMRARYRQLSLLMLTDRNRSTIS